MMNTVCKDSSNVKSTSTEDEQNQSEDHSQKKKIHHKTEGEETNFTVNNTIRYNRIEST